MSYEKLLIIPLPFTLDVVYQLYLDDREDEVIDQETIQLKGTLPTRKSLPMYLALKSINFPLKIPYELAFFF